MSKYSELVADLRRGVEFDMRREKPFCIRDAAAAAITKLEAEKAELVSLLTQVNEAESFGDLMHALKRGRALFAKLEAGQ